MKSIILFQVIKAFKWQIWIISVGCLLLLLIYGHNVEPTLPFSDNLWNVLDPISGILTFIISMIILYVQSRNNWENNLEKRLNANYVLVDEAQNMPLLIVEQAYLSSEADIRQWAQQLGRQVMDDINFDMNWDDPEPEIRLDNETNRYYKLYKITVYLTSNPFNEEKGATKLKEFLDKRFKYSKVDGNASMLPIRWVRLPGLE